MTKDKRGDYLDAIERFEAAVEAKVARQGTTGTIDISAAVVKLRTAADAFRPGCAEPGIAAMKSTIANFVAEQRTAGFTTAINAARGSLMIRNAARELHRSASEFDRQPELDQVRQSQSVARDELAELDATLEAAIEHGDLEQIMRLRPRVEVELPARVGQLELDRLQLVAERAEADAAVPHELARRANVRREQAQKRADDLRASLTDAETELRISSEIAAAYTHGAENAERSAAAMRGQLQKHAQQLEQENTNRVRRLAGLPDLEPAPQQLPKANAPARTGEFINVRQAQFSVQPDYQWPSEPIPVPKVNTFTRSEAARA